VIGNNNIIKEAIKAEYKKKTLSIKTTSIHSYSQLEHLKESLSGKESLILIARITPILSKDSQAGTKLVDELYSSQTVKDNYSVFRLGEERIIVVPSDVQSKEVLL
jgi:SepF-like predicted cell division protein (DUF552 family)